MNIIGKSLANRFERREERELFTSKRRDGLSANGNSRRNLGLITGLRGMSCLGWLDGPILRPFL